MPFPPRPQICLDIVDELLDQHVDTVVLQILQEFQKYLRWRMGASVFAGDVELDTESALMEHMLSFSSECMRPLVSALQPWAGGLPPEDNPFLFMQVLPLLQWSRGARA